MTLIFGFGVYIIGFILSIIFLSTFGKKIGIDYSGEKNYVNYDDWDSNKTAYTTFSLVWPFFYLILIIGGFWYLLTSLTSLIIKD
jgi:CRISPR/Cas system-associated endonuclease/helicase Cas3